MSLANAKKILERLGKSVCITGGDVPSGADLNRQWAVNQSLFSAIVNAPYAFIDDQANIIAFPETTIGDDQRVAGPGLFAVAVEIADAPAAANNWLGVLLGKRAVGKAGKNAEVNAVNFFIRGRPNQSYTITPGEVFQYIFDAQGNRQALLPPDAGSGGGGSTTITFNDGSTNIVVNSNSMSAYAVAQRQWESTGGPKVLVKLLTGYSGSTTGNAFYVDIRGGSEDQDPNVLKGQILEIMIDGDGDYYTADPGAWDAKIGSVKQFLFDPESDLYVKDGSVILNGWRRMNGTDNGSAAGGTGLDVEGYYLFAKEEASEDVDGDDLIAAGSHTHGVPGGTTTSVSVAAHDDHVHLVGCACGSGADVPNGGATYIGFLNFVDQHTPSGIVYTGIQLTNHAGGHGSTTLTHAAHDHTFPSGTSGSGHSDPAKVRMIFLERCRNDYEHLGV